jgi:hypothetical protein
LDNYKIDIQEADANSFMPKNILTSITQQESVNTTSDTQQFAQKKIGQIKNVSTLLRRLKVLGSTHI